MRKWFFYIAPLFFLSGCSEQYQPINITDLSMEVETDDFSDTLYYIRNFNVTSTNDSVLTFAKGRISDENGTILIEDNWQNIANSFFGLAERRNYELNIAVYRIIDGIETIDHTSSYDIDNNDYPDFIKINSIEMDAGAVASGTYDVSSVHTSIVRIYNWIEYGDLSDEEYSVDDQVIYLDKSYPPQSLNFNFTNLQLPVRSYDKRLWKYYSIRVQYPLVYAGTVVDERVIRFLFDIETRVKSGNISAGVEYSLASDNDASDGGGAYFGNLKYEWIYE